MSSSSWDRLRDLVERALELPEEERGAFLEAAAAGDDALLGEARAVLAQEPPARFLEPPGGPDAAATAFAGRTIGGYTLGPVIGAGGMGVVHRAVHDESGRAVAFKVLPPLQMARPAAAERFRRESMIARHARHEAVVDVLEEGTTSELSWFAMELVEGHDLAKELALQRAARRGEPAEGTLLPRFGTEHYRDAIIRLVARLARALAHGHGRGVLHRDVKPRNVLLDRSGRAFLGDFGLARLVDLATITRSGDVQGTPHYMSPEQARASRRPIDARSDQYSLAVVLYELLTLGLPYEGSSSREVLDRISRGPARSLREVAPDLPEDLVVVCEKAMARRPVERFSDCAAFADDLDRVLARRSIAARPRGLLSRARDVVERNAWLVVSVLAAGATALVLWGAQAWVTHHAASRAAAADARAALGLVRWDVDDDLEVLRRGLRAIEGGLLGDELRGELLARLESERARWVDAVRAEVAAGLGGYSDPAKYGGLDAPLDERRVLFAQQRARRLLRLLPEDPDLVQLARPESTFPRVLIEGDGAVPASAVALPRDPVLDTFGDPVELGPLPVDRRLPPGDWRIVVTGPGGALAEFDRVLERRADAYSIRARHRPAPAVTSDMVRVPATRPVFREPRPAGCRIVPGAVDVPAFWIDEAEVSNREYLAFLEENQDAQAPPHLWTCVGYGGDWRALPGVVELGPGREERWLDLPAVGMSVADMRAYAEWRGKRLPTHLEAEVALRGEELREAFVAEGARANVGGPPELRGENAAKYAQYVAATLPVREPGYRQPPYGLFHVYGNVTEFTSSRFVQPHDGAVRIHRYENVRLLTDWDDLTEVVPFVSHGPSGVGDLYVAATRGFRCARSVGAGD